MIQAIKEYLKSWFCKHTFVWIRNIYGDEIYMTGTFKRSWWKCTKCNVHKSDTNLYNIEGYPSAPTNDAPNTLTNQELTIG